MAKHTNQDHALVRLGILQHMLQSAVRWPDGRPAGSHFSPWGLNGYPRTRATISCCKRPQYTAKNCHTQEEGLRQVGVGAAEPQRPSELGVNPVKPRISQLLHATSCEQLLILHAHVVQPRPRCACKRATPNPHMAGSACVQLAFLLLSLAWTAIQSQPGEQLVSVRSGQELADAVAAWAFSGNHTTIQIDAPFISVRNASFHDYSAMAAKAGAPPFITGRLSIRGHVNQDGTPATVLDAGMRYYLISGLGQMARLEISNLIVVNNCEFDGPIPAELASHPWMFPLLIGAIDSAARTQVNLWLYGRQAAFELSMYGYAVFLADLPAVSNIIASSQILSTWATGMRIDVTNLTAHSVSSSRMNTLDTETFNSSYRSDENPDDPLVQIWRSQGLLMPPQKCDGTPVVSAQTMQLVAPIWISVQQSTFASKLEKAAINTVAPHVFNGLPVVLLLDGQPVVAPDTASYQVLGHLMLMGSRLGSLPSWDLLPSINLNQRVNLLNIAPGADVVIKGLSLSGLAVQVPARLPPSLAGQTSHSLLPSAFPLSGFNTSAGADTWNRTAQVILGNVTLIIPPDDYLALLILTSSQGRAGIPACADPTISQRVDQLLAGISSWSGSSAAYTSVEQHIQQQDQQLFLRSFTGWGLNATYLRLVPATPLAMPPCESSGQSNKTHVVGLAVGMACSGVLLLAVLASLVSQARRRSDAAATSTNTTPITQAPSKLQTVETGETGAHQLSIRLSIVTASLTASTKQPRLTGLLLLLHEAHASQERVLASAAVSTTAAVANKQASSDGQHLGRRQLHGQVEELAAKLQQDDQHLLLAGVLGAGGSGTVYIGLWRGLPVAVKTVVFHEAMGARAARRSRQAIFEAAISASLGHKNVVATYHYDIKALETKQDEHTEGGLRIDMVGDDKQAEQRAYKLFLVQELCNISLADSLRSGLLLHPGTQLLDVRALLVVLLDIGCGLEYLHSKNIIHGDLKPENVLLKVDQSCPEGVVAKLADFGLSARLLPGHTHISNHDCGTPFYVAPEVAGWKQLAPVSDMFSFGVMMWELYMQRAPYQRCKGKRPFMWDPLFPRYPDSETVPSVYVQLTHRCLHHDLRERPSASEAISILTSLLLSLN